MGDVQSLLQHIWPDWKIEEKIGEGTFTSVYKAVWNDPSRTRYAAIKIIHIPTENETIDSPLHEDVQTDLKSEYCTKLSRAYLTEVQQMEALNGCLNIVSIDDAKTYVSETEKARYIFIRMELLTPLDEWIKGKKLTEARIIDVGIDLCKALEFSGKYNITHGNIKPQNILMDKNGSAKLSDFEVASEKAVSLHRKSTNFTAPEVYHSALSGSDFAANTQADIYSLGIVLYWLSNDCKPPFVSAEEENPSQAIRREAFDRRINGERVPAPAGVSEGLQRIILKACEFKPENRFDNVTSMKNALGALLDSFQHEMLASEPTSDRKKSRHYFAESIPAMPAISAIASPGAPRFSLGRLIMGAIEIAIEAHARRKEKKRNLKASFKDDESKAQAELHNNAAEPESDLHSSDAKTQDALLLDVPRLNAVQFSAIAPQCFQKGHTSIVDILMYEENKRSIVETVKAEYDYPVKETHSGIQKVRENTRVRILLSSPDLELNDCFEEQTWCGGSLRFSFVVELPQNYPKPQVCFTAKIYFDGVPATCLKLVTECGSENHKLKLHRLDINSAFMSYASQDRAKVAARIQGMQKVRPELDLFFDVENLHSGDNWQEVIQNEIDHRDALFLCWSHFASKSKWVDWEWRYALKQKGESSIDILPLEPPTVCPPPEALNKKHFNEKLLVYINEDSADEKQDEEG